ncbi:hypothetical protein OH76DRAFT_1482925 [Lentinus brumalis]|uniref:Uncharacterized protein n=1 Tax=Lentinus brumalis TaxID=2498619 RepID=A0A371DAH7_9APHY|nr:hypothetical protein OH76DRAFT_1482925 [Polyporus brumalis]
MTEGTSKNYYVILGGNNPGIYDTRPANVALHDFKPLVPIVVVCTNREDAESIFLLHHCIFSVVDADDAHGMIYRLQHWKDTTADLQVNRPIYAVKCGMQTGVFVGYSWSDIEHFITVPAGKKYSPRWEGFFTIVDALVFMVKKPGYNLPLVSSGAPLPPPPTPTRTKQLRFDFPALSSTSEASGRLQVPASPTKTEFVGPSRAGSPVKTTTTPSSASTAGRSLTPASRGVDELTAAFRDVLGGSPGLMFLRRFVRAPPSMGGMGNPPLPPLMFGEEADELLQRSGVEGADLLTLLQIRVHARTVESFTHHVGLSLGWSTRDATRLWDIMKVPDL